MAYPSPDRVCNIASPTLVTFAGICNDNLEVFIFKQYLLNTTVVAPLLLWSPLLDVVLIIVT